jgi:hypothetical protein
MMQIGKAWKRLIVYQPDSTLTERKVTPFPRDDDRDYRGIVSRKWSSERWIIFRWYPTEHSGGERFEGHQRTTDQADDWKEGNFFGLVQETERDMKTYLFQAEWNTRAACQDLQRDDAWGDLRGAVKYATATGEALCWTLMLLTRRPVSVTESLVSKHPEARTQMYTTSPPIPKYRSLRS